MGLWYGGNVTGDGVSRKNGNEAMTTSIHPGEDPMDVAGVVLPDVPRKPVKKVQRGVLYRADGRAFPVKPENGKKFVYDELSEAVSGLIEGIIPTKNAVPYVMGYPVDRFKAGANAGKVTQVWANEEGLIDGLPLNPHTPMIADMRVYKLNGYPDSWRISGDVIAIYNVPVDKLEPTLEDGRMLVKEAKFWQEPKPPSKTGILR
jgi:hypothetical protein